MKDKRILVVDDESTIRDLLEETIKGLHPDITIVHAEHGAHAWEIVSNSDLPFDLIISDVNMPKMNGVKLIEQFRTAYPESHVILMSGNPEPKGHVAHVFMPKPFGALEVLQRVVRGLLPTQAV
jgi:YesN/AraC family two-component response regulator